MLKNQTQYKKVNMKQIEKRITKIISTDEALATVEPIHWSEDVTEGKKEVVISQKE